MSARFQNKIAVVTGAGSVGPGWGNGRAIAVALVREGAHVVALDISLRSMDETLASARTQATHGGTIESMVCDVTQVLLADINARIVGDAVAILCGLEQAFGGLALVDLGTGRGAKSGDPGKQRAARQINHGRALHLRGAWCRARAEPERAGLRHLRACRR